jgi:uridine phosphorylase
MDYPPSELVLDAKGHVYHLGIGPEDLAGTVLLVGDQGRVAQVSQFFDTLEHTSQHREFCCHTGTYRGKRVTALSSGIGTDNIDIVVNELDALVNIDLATRTDKPVKTSLDLVRIGTCGILQADVPVHAYILSAFAYGLDNVAHFYPLEFTELESEIAASLTRHLGLPETIRPYCKQASHSLFEALSSDDTWEGINVSSSGFYGPQGRRLRLGLRNADINERLGDFRHDLDGSPLRVMNFEMESSALFALGQGLGHRTATICLGIANRPTLEFTRGYEEHMNGLIRYVLDRLT